MWILTVAYHDVDVWVVGKVLWGSVSVDGGREVVGTDGGLGGGLRRVGKSGDAVEGAAAGGEEGWKVRGGGSCGHGGRTEADEGDAKGLLRRGHVFQSSFYRLPTSISFC